MQEAVAKLRPRKEDRASREKLNKFITKIKIKIILFDLYTKFFLISRPLGRLKKNVSSFATATQLGAKRMQGKCVEDELLSLLD